MSAYWEKHKHLRFPTVEPPPGVALADWQDWRWQNRLALKSQANYEQTFSLTESEADGFLGQDKIFQVRTTPYYAELGRKCSAVRKMLMPQSQELQPGHQQMPDPLGENQHSPTPRIVHRYPDRVLFLVTDFCSVYCRYCLRKHFTGKNQAMVKGAQYQEALEYIEKHPGVREVILSGGDPLTLADGQLNQILGDLRKIDHVEMIRLGTRGPVVCPMRVTDELLQVLQAHKPVYFMVHFNHPKELTAQAAAALEKLVDHGIPVFNQMVLLNGINNHPAIVQALSRRLIYLRVKPYYMFQCDPSVGTDHFRTSVDESLGIQRELWGRLSGLAMPNLSLDIPGGGGKVGYTPDFELEKSEGVRHFRGWDGIENTYIDPPKDGHSLPEDLADYQKEWQKLLTDNYGGGV